MGTISDVAIKYSKGRMIRQQPEGHDTFADMAIKSDRAKVVMTAGSISEIADITTYIYDTRER